MILVFTFCLQNSFVGLYAHVRLFYFKREAQCCSNEGKQSALRPPLPLPLIYPTLIRIHSIYRLCVVSQHRILSDGPTVDTHRVAPLLPAVPALFAEYRSDTLPLFPPRPYPHPLSYPSPLAAFASCKNVHPARSSVHQCRARVR